MISFQMNINKPVTCAFSGHRPQKMPSIFERDGSLKLYFSELLKNEIKKAISRGYKFFISGGGLGFDLSAAECVIDLKSEYPFISLEFALPCYDHYVRWRPKQIEKFMSLLDKSDKIVYVSETPYFKGCMAIRNQYMVERSSLIICVYNGSPGGTKNTLKYADKSFVDVIFI